MKQIANWNEIKEAGEYEKLPAGGYVCRIASVEDVANKEYLKIEYDIAEGPFTGYFERLNESLKFWGGNFIRSYKVSAESFFKQFVTAVESSNARFKFDFDESKLAGKKVGLVLGEEEYQGNDGKIKKRLKVSMVRSVAAIHEGDYKVPELVTFGVGAGTPTANASNDIDVPF